MALNQAQDIRTHWKANLRMQASACKGATEGRELRGGKLNRHQMVYDSADPATCTPSTTASPSKPDRPILLLFLGDSLVSGVGAQPDGDPAPAALPRSVAAHLAEQAGKEVKWASVGITGATVERLTREGLPRLKEKIAAQDGACTVVVILVVGVNDLRTLKLATYRLALRSLVRDLRHVACTQQAVDAVFLPALRIADAPMLQRFPLQCFLGPICSLWEREKRKAIKWVQEAEVLPFPPPPEGVSIEAMFSPDLMHPSLTGYEWWAEGLARQIHQKMLPRETEPEVTMPARPVWEFMREQQQLSAFGFSFE